MSVWNGKDGFLKRKFRIREKKMLRGVFSPPIREYSEGMRLTYADYWDIHHRKSTRLKGHDYTGAGMYFVTICTAGRDYLFGNVSHGQMQLNESGTIVRDCWIHLPLHFPFVSLDEFVVMPNHVHGIVILQPKCRGKACMSDTSAVACRGKACLAPTTQSAPTTGMEFQKPPAQSLCSVVGSFKSAVTREANILRNAPGECVWQRNYHDHIIRNGELGPTRQYIADNPKNWLHDEHHWR